jgi:micrococcal nuclease
MTLDPKKPRLLSDSKNRINKKIFIAFALGALSTAALSGWRPSFLKPKGANYTALSCNDGDTCRLMSPDGTEVRVRLVGIDAPEFSGKRHDAQPMSAESKEFLNNLVKNKEVQLVSHGTDGFRRELGEIIVGKINANLEMVEQGLAEVYRGRPPKSLNTDFYKEAESRAKLAKKGIWGLSNYQSPKEFRAQNRK